MPNKNNKTVINASEMRSLRKVDGKSGKKAGSEMRNLGKDF